VLRRTVATHVQGIGSVKDIQYALRHAKRDTAQINYVQPLEDSVRSAVDKLASVIATYSGFPVLQVVDKD